MELLKHYDMSLHYPLGKANIVVDALSRLSTGSLAHVEEGLDNLKVHLLDFKDNGVFVQQVEQSSLG